MNLIISTKVSVNPDGDFVTTILFANGQTLSWFEKEGELDVVTSDIDDTLGYIRGIPVTTLNRMIVKLLKK